VLVYHGTGATPQSVETDLKILPVSDSSGFIIAAPQAVSGRMGGPDDPDHWESITYATGWNLSDKSAATNDDVLLTRAIIDAASRAYGIDLRRVYSMGHSNGAFFSYFVAMMIPNEIAAFAEASGGAIRCANRGTTQFTGTGTTCEALAAEAGYPQCSGTLKPIELPAGRVPPGYLAHNNNDAWVSVAWTCTLSQAMGSNALTDIFAPSAESTGHAVPVGFATSAWSFVSQQSLPN
jgi:hypothetical protein